MIKALIDIEGRYLRPFETAAANYWLGCLTWSICMLSVISYACLWFAVNCQSKKMEKMNRCWKWSYTAEHSALIALVFSSFSSMYDLLDAIDYQNIQLSLCWTVHWVQRLNRLCKCDLIDWLIYQHTYMCICITACNLFAWIQESILIMIFKYKYTFA